MRSPVFFLLVSLAVILGLGYPLLSGPRGNWPETDFVIAVFITILPFLVAAVIAAIAAVRGRNAPFPAGSVVRGVLVCVLVAGTVWTLMMLMVMVASSG